MNRPRFKLVFLAVAVVLATLAAPSRWASRLEGLLADLLSPLTRMGESARAGMAGLTTRDGGSGPDEDVRSEMRRLRALAARLEEVQAENDRLRRLLDFRRQIPFDVVGARVIGRDSAQWWQTILIDAGRGQGVAPQMAVLADGGLLGRTTDEIGQRTARVLLLVDPNSRAGAMLARSRAYGLLEGMDQRGLPRPTCRMLYVSRHSDVRIGDAVVTSGLGGVYPSGIPIGSVVEAGMSKDDLYQVLTVELFADARRAEEVMVVLAGDRPWAP